MASLGMRCELLTARPTHSPKSKLNRSSKKKQTEKVLENLKSSFDTADEIDGFEEITEDDQEKVRKAFEVGHVADEDIPETARKPDPPSGEEEQEDEKPKKKVCDAFRDRSWLQLTLCISSAQARGRRRRSRTTRTLRKNPRRRYAAFLPRHAVPLAGHICLTCVDSIVQAPAKKKAKKAKEESEEEQEAVSSEEEVSSSGSRVIA